ncbi:MAG: hypothetical protein LQ337_001192 [Flavoplaca oasis]|nr:MAG: hypothetical protein LQ337_001192 [Flavoplaca oasis]
MAASGLDVYVIVYDISESVRASGARDPAAYWSYTQNDIRALSTNTHGDQDISGFLFVPDYPQRSPCIDRTSQYIPQNVTRLDDIPSLEGGAIALAPWTSPECVLTLFEAVRNIKAFIFYLPDSQPGSPPPVNDPAWYLGDGGSWKSRNKFPVYAIPGPTGTSIMNQLGQYSGSISDAPNASRLVEQFPNRNGAKLFAGVELSNVTSLPSLWAFLLIVLGIVLFMIGFTSGVMHLYQRRRRNVLRRRIVNGEVDLERLGIKRLTVPQEAIDMLPTFVYNPSEKELLDVSRGHVTALSDFPIKESDNVATASPPLEPTLNAESYPVQPPVLSPAAVPIQSSPEPKQQQPSYAQPTCPICLDDFIPQETTVRSLPCHHIYHPECIDPFLLRNSSLCPVCKAKVLPVGFCPELITNAMVRRERQQRRNRDRVLRIRGEETAAQMPVASNLEARPSRFTAVQGRMGLFGRGSRPASTARLSQSPTSSAAVEMRNMNHDAMQSASAPIEPNASATIPTPAPTESQPEQAQPTPTPTSTTTPNSRSERARRRASLFLRDQQPTVEEQERERWTRLPRWRKAIKSVFPGF